MTEQIELFALAAERSLWPLIILGLLQVADVWSTNRALRKNPYAYERNLVMRLAMRALGDVWPAAKIALAGVGVLVLVLYVEQPSRDYMLWALNALYIYTVWQNYKLGNV
jgi:hypothetical protein